MKKRNLFFTMFVVLFAAFNAQANTTKYAQCALQPVKFHFSSKDIKNAKKWLQKNAPVKIRQAAKKAGISVSDSQIKAMKGKAVDIGRKVARTAAPQNLPNW